MQYALRFFVNADGVSYWIHGHDLPGDLASHGCIGLADEQIQLQYYHMRARPELADAKRFYEWVMGALLSFSSSPAMEIKRTTPRCEASAQPMSLR